MEIVVTGRRTKVSDRFHRHVEDKLAKIERLDPKIIRVDVEVSEERNPRLADQRERVEITCRSRGPVIRAEAAADEVYAALDLAWAKLESRLRRVTERRADRQVTRVTGPGGAPVRAVGLSAAGATATAVVASPEDDLDADLLARYVEDESGESPIVVREKVHASAPMTLDEAMTEMELVGHDFFLYQDSDAGLPSVLYKRHGYSYGVIRLST